VKPNVDLPLTLINLFLMSFKLFGFPSFVILRVLDDDYFKNESCTLPYNIYIIYLHTSIVK
jgi:hypothetical protein